MDDFHAFVQMVKPTVILGRESWLNDSIADAEVFPDRFTCYRKDRNNHGTGAFILVHNSVASWRLTIEADDCEAVWCQIKLFNHKVVTVCSFYRPP